MFLQCESRKGLCFYSVRGGMIGVSTVYEQERFVFLQCERRDDWSRLLGSHPWG